MKSIFKSLMLLSISLFSAHAACQVGDYSFQANISDATLAEAYELEIAPLRVDDSVVLTNVKSGEEYVFDIGSFYDDGAGNFEIMAISSEHATSFGLYHDHETWHQGLSGEFSLPSGEFIDLSVVKDCDYDKLF